MKIFGALVLIIVLTGATTASFAKCPKVGYCPPGTCADNGGKRACDVKNCSKQNCTRGQHK